MMKRISDQRTAEQVGEHYEIEKKLADRLRNASPRERSKLYGSLYDELFRRVPLHPQLTRKVSAGETQKRVSMQVKLIKPFLRKDATFMEVGAGDCALSFEVSRFVNRVLAVDVSEEITRGVTRPPNVEVRLIDGIQIALPPNSVDIAYSHHLMEHLHPEDALEQLTSIYNALAPGGVYICVTPNRLSGPHDVSKYFDDVATGFHLKEYTTFELRSLVGAVGFSRFAVRLGGMGMYLSVPSSLVALYEKLLDALPQSPRRRIASMIPFRLLLGSRFVAYKSRCS
jgi:SAM-dependent methyltransferase